MSGYRVFHQGQEYMSITGAAEVLGRSARTVRRWERAGILPRPVSIPRGSADMRWYAVDEVERWAEIVRQTEQAGEDPQLALRIATGGSERTGRAPGWDRSTRSGRRQARSVESFADEVDADADWDIWGGEQTVKTTASPAPEHCPRCDQELVWHSRGIAGARPEHNIVPVCSLHGEIDLHPPVAKPGSCARCGGDVLYEVIEGGKGFLPVCDSCGVTHVVPEPVEVKREPVARYASFPSVEVAVGRGARPRGMYDGFLPGAVRKTKAPTTPTYAPLDPPPRATRPG